MTITTQDIQLRQPEVLDDTNNGGGRMSPNLVVDGELNNLFDDRSRFDHTVGRVSMRKGWFSVESNNRTKLIGAHAILLQRALDPKVHVSMFARDSHTDRRDDAQNHLEQYLAAGATLPFYCWDTQPAGAMIVTLLTEIGNAIPAAGDVIVLSVERGTINNGQQQFVRCIDVQISEAKATVPPNFMVKTLQQVDITIDQPLRFDVPGESFGFQQPNVQSTLVRRTTQAGGKRYYSIHQVIEDVEAGDTACVVDDIMTPVVPSAQQDIPVVDQQVGSDTVSLIPIGGPGSEGLLTEVTAGISIVSGAATILPEHALIPGSVLVNVRPAGQGAGHQHHLLDDGRGVLVRQPSSGANVPPTVAGTVDYRNRQIIITGMSVNAGALDLANSSITYRPAVALVEVQHTDSILVTEANRGLVFTRTLLPKPAPGALVVSYRALGEWITLRDRGDGTIAGEAGEGTGTVNYSTGGSALTLGAEPDIGSRVLFGWASGVHYQVPSGPVQAKLPEIVIELDKPVLPGSLSITYPIGETTHTITDDGAGHLEGDGTGTVEYGGQAVRLVPTHVPASGAVLTVAYESSVNRYTETPVPVIAGGSTSIELANDNADTRSVLLKARYTTASPEALSDPFEIELVDDGLGKIMTRKSVDIAAGEKYCVVRGWFQVGTINYATSVITLSSNVANAIYSGHYNTSIWTAAYSGYPMTFESLVSVRYSAAGSPEVEEEEFPLTQLELSLTGEELLYSLQAASLWIEFNGRRYYDRNGLFYYRDTNGNEQPAGSADYRAGRMVLTSWAAGATTGHLRGALSVWGRWPMTHVVWRVPVDRQKTGAFQLTYLRIGESVPDQASVDNAGDIVGPGGLTGTVNADTGVYELTWSAAEVLPENASYSTVAVNHLPLDPAILGLDPVRLSTDGRVATIQKADVGVLFNIASVTLPNPVIAGSTHATRPFISALEVRDNQGELVPSDRYGWVKATGAITFVNPLDLDDYEQPLKVFTRIEDMVLVTDAQLNGRVAFLSPVTHDYPAETSWLSTALPLGNELQASVFNVFSQLAWTNVWSDDLIGTSPVLQYNNITHPILVHNKGAIRERWRLDFTSVTAYRVIGETVGLVGVGDIYENCSPINPATGTPYMTIYAAGLSGGANVGNQLRFNTEAAARPIWFIRCALPGPVTEPQDRFQVELRGDAN